MTTTNQAVLHQIRRDVFFVKSRDVYELCYRPSVGSVVLAVYRYTKTEFEDGQSEYKLNREFASNAEMSPADLEADFRRLTSLDGGDDGIRVHDVVELAGEYDFDSLEEYKAYETPFFRVEFRGKTGESNV